MKKFGLISALMLGSMSVAAYDVMDICLVTGQPSTDVQVESIKRIKIAKGSYGSVTDILPVFGKEANSLGANAVVNYVGSQRFGFWPWRFVRPIVRGEAAKIDFNNGKTCESIGGATIRRVIETNKEPHLVNS